ncbi:MAG: hypothetical protein EBR85_08670 [Betaproteobacteria bacterium]|nr:hypothetical protein [Verrucomicrobiota bacterium]NBW01753.1 hypothetical protein [Betaproteobacteria bacterium]
MQLLQVITDNERTITTMHTPSLIESKLQDLTLENTKLRQIICVVAPSLATRLDLLLANWEPKAATQQEARA